MSTWISVDERLPEPTQLVLLIATHVKKGSALDYTTDHFCGWRDNRCAWARWPHDFPPTHWMELPEPPK